MSPFQQPEQAQPTATVMTPVSVIDVLLEQHARIRELFARVNTSESPAKQAWFDELRELLAVHEAGEEMILRPVSKTLVGADVAQACNDEEKQAAIVLAALEKLDVTTPEFAERFAAFEQDVSNHAAYEESEEFPHLLSACDFDQQEKMAVRLIEAQRTAPTHPHPTATGSTAAQYTTAPFAALLDRARDTFTR